MPKRLPTKREYFDLFEQIARAARRAAEVFCSSSSPEDKREALKLLETEGDGVVKTVTDLLDGHQDPPLRDTGDIYHLVDNIDDIIDSLKKAANRIALHRLSYIPAFLSMAELVLEASQKIEQVLPLLRNIRKNRDAIRGLCIDISGIESAGDEREEKCIESLRSPTNHGGSYLEDCEDKMHAERIIELLEHALNQCEDVSKFMDALKKKNA